MCSVQGGLLSPRDSQAVTGLVQGYHLLSSSPWGQQRAAEFGISVWKPLLALRTPVPRAGQVVGWKAQVFKGPMTSPAAVCPSPPLTFPSSSPGLALSFFLWLSGQTWSLP